MYVKSVDASDWQKCELCTDNELNLCIRIRKKKTKYKANVIAALMLMPP